MNKLFILPALALALTACGAQQQAVTLAIGATAEARQCSALGFVPGTDKFSNCEGVMSRRLSPEEY